MRREGEKKLAEDVQKLMFSWKSRLQSCNVVFVSCPPTQRSILFGDVLQRTDARVRRIPFSGIGKPSLESCVRAHALVCSVLFFHAWPQSVKVQLLPCFPEGLELPDEIDSLDESTTLLSQTKLPNGAVEQHLDHANLKGSTAAQETGEDVVIGGKVGQSEQLGIIDDVAIVETAEAIWRPNRKHPRRRRCKPEKTDCQQVCRRELPASQVPCSRKGSLASKSPHSHQSLHRKV